MFNPDTELAIQSQETGISIARLKAVYLRGVEEFRSTENATGTANLYGCARVQRFINGVLQGSPPKCDADLVGSAQTPQAAQGVDVCVEAQSMFTDIIYDNASMLSQLFYPAQVTAVNIEDDRIILRGVLDGEDWTYELNTASGDHTLALR